MARRGAVDQAGNPAQAEALGMTDLNGGALFNAEFGIIHRGSTVPERSGVALSFCRRWYARYQEKIRAIGIGSNFVQNVRKNDNGAADILHFRDELPNEIAEPSPHSRCASRLLLSWPVAAPAPDRKRTGRSRRSGASGLLFAGRHQFVFEGLASLHAWCWLNIQCAV